MSKTTRATQALEGAGVAFTLHTYDYDPDAPRIGLQAAEALGEDPCRVLKTLMAEVDGKPVCVVVPSDQEVSMKKLAAAFGGKSANMMKAPDAERLTGFVVGGISPFGQKKAVPTRSKWPFWKTLDLHERWPARPAGAARTERRAAGRWKPRRRT